MRAPRLSRIGRVIAGLGAVLFSATAATALYFGDWFSGLSVAGVAIACVVGVVTGRDLVAADSPHRTGQLTRARKAATSSRPDSAG